MSTPNLSSAHPEETPSPRPPLMPATAATDPKRPVPEPPDGVGRVAPARSNPPAIVPASLASVTECLNCGKPIRTMAFRFTGVCSGNCQKRLAERKRRDEIGLPPVVVLP